VAVKIPKVADTKLPDKELERLRRQHEEAIKALETELRSLSARVGTRHWAHLKQKTDQAAISAGTLITLNEVVYQTGCVRPGEDGVIAITREGWWRLTFGAYLNHSAAQACNFKWFHDPLGMNLALGQWGQYIPAPHASNLSTGGHGGSAMAYLRTFAPGAKVGVRVDQISGGGTIGTTALVVKALIEQVDPWLE
jgi:hypothetical protein